MFNIGEINSSNNLLLDYLKNQSQSDGMKRRISNALWKDSIKWAIAATLSGLFLVYLWMQSKWARVGISSST